MTYDFSQLNDKEFEALVADLLSVKLGKQVERFKPGKDGGVDGRFYSDSNKETILQCKHYLKTGFGGLISKLKNDEAKKVNKLSPERYIFITSLPLTRDNKKEIKEIFSPYLKREDDIFGQEDLNDILSQNPKIEEKFFKLWISSSNVFDRVINNAIKGRSENELKRAKEKTKLFVKTQNFIDALDRLEKNHVVIITGEPGIGKTTLAENLCLLYANDEFEFSMIEESVSEAENIFKPKQKQIFYFDDFLGSNYLEAIDYKKDSHIIGFIERISRDNSKRFILTSRTNILNSGILHSPIFVDRKINKNEFLLKIESLTKYDKAKILYNHIWHSKLSEDFISEIYSDKRYHRIIEHKNFSPRIIEFITDNDRISIKNSSEYWNYIQQTLDNPADIWDQCFKIQCNEHIRNLVSAVSFNNSRIDEPQLRNAYYLINKLEGLINYTHTDKNFDSMCEVAVSIFLTRTKTDGRIYYQLFNPSIADYIINNYSNNLEKVKKIFASLNTLESLRNLNDLFKREIIDVHFKEDIYRYIFEHSFLDNFQNLDYKIKLSHTVCNFKWSGDQIIDLLNYILENPYEGGQIEYLFYLLDDFFDKINEIDEDLVFDLTESYSSWHDQDILSFSRFLENRFSKSESLKERLEEALYEFLLSSVDDLILDMNLEDFIDYQNHYHFYDFESEVVFDTNGARNEFENQLYKGFDFFFSDLPNVEEIEVNIDSIIDTVNFEQILRDYDSNRAHEDEGFSQKYHGSRDNGFTNIDDLFERS